MKKILFFAALFVSASLFLPSCTQDACTREITYTKYTPVFMPISEIRVTPTADIGRALENPGKIYSYNNYILVNELKEGIHVIDNTNPEAPQNVAFINIPGNIDMAVKNNVLYADNVMDLLAIDISDPLNPVLLNRSQDVFPTFGNSTEGILAYYDEEVVTEVVECNGGGLWWGFEDGFGGMLPLSSNSGSNGSTGVGGSMARFTITDDYLYTVDNSDLRVFDISSASTPTQVSQVSVGWNIETIFPNEDKLFIGSRSGMFIYDISTPTSPSFMSNFEHANACDPVFVDGNTAYVTLRSGTACEGFNNQLDVIDITNLQAPSLLKTYPMDNPHGLAVANKTLFLCEGEHGLKSLDVKDPMDIKQLSFLKDFATYDVIALSNNILLVIGADGLYQYDYTDPSNLELLSKLSVNN